MAKITKLTAEQEKCLVDFREEWRAIGLSCKPADHATGDAIITEFYERIGKKPPMILHFSSPMMCELAVAWVMSVAKEKPQKVELWGQLRDQLRDQLWLQVNRPTALEHLRPYDTHETIMFEPGIYEVRRQREYTPEGFRRVED